MPNTNPNLEQPQDGFTLIELIMVMVLVGILSIAIIPRFVNKSAFDALGFVDQSKTILRYAQKVAIAQRTNVFVNITATTICLTYVADATCASTTQSEKVFALTPMPLASDQSWMKKSAPNGSAFGTTISFSFSALGKPSLAGTTIINLTADSIAKTITVERDTGYVH